MKVAALCEHSSHFHEKTPSLGAWGFAMDAEKEGFEPPEPHSSTVFKTAAIDHSATSPAQK